MVSSLFEHANDSLLRGSTQVLGSSIFGQQGATFGNLFQKDHRYLSTDESGDLTLVKGAAGVRAAQLVSRRGEGHTRGAANSGIDSPKEVVGNLEMII
jgi:hypothetical protein